MKTCKVSLIVLLSAVTACVLGCHGSAFEPLGHNGANRHDPVAGVWTLFALGASFQGPWSSCGEPTCSGTWTINSDNTWTRTVKIANRPEENSEGMWATNGANYVFASDTQPTTTFYYYNGDIYYAIQETGVSIGALRWQRQ